MKKYMTLSEACLTDNPKLILKSLKEFKNDLVKARGFSVHAIIINTIRDLEPSNYPGLPQYDHPSIIVIEDNSLGKYMAHSVYNYLSVILLSGSNDSNSLLNYLDERIDFLSNLKLGNKNRIITSKELKYALELITKHGVDKEITSEQPLYIFLTTFKHNTSSGFYSNNSNNIIMLEISGNHPPIKVLLHEIGHALSRNRGIYEMHKDSCFMSLCNEVLQDVKQEYNVIDESELKEIYADLFAAAMLYDTPLKEEVNAMFYPIRDKLDLIHDYFCKKAVTV